MTEAEFQAAVINRFDDIDHRFNDVTDKLDALSERIDLLVQRQDVVTANTEQILQILQTRRSAGGGAPMRMVAKGN